MKRSHRVGAICQLLTESPHKVFNLKYFCDKFSAAKSSISEDISAVAAAVRANGLGYIETMPGAAGGVKYVPDISHPGRRLPLHIGHHVQPDHRKGHGSDIRQEVQILRSQLCGNYRN